MSNSEEISVRIDYTEAVLLGSWDTLKDYIKRMETQLVQATKNFEKWEKSQLAELPPEKHEEFREAFVEEYINYYREFPRILYNSLLVSACSLLEYQLGVICRKIKADKGIPISWSDLKGEALARAKLYCKLGKLEVSGDEPVWQEIDNYFDVRHCIVHCNGLVDEYREKDRKSLVSYLERKSIIGKEPFEETKIVELNSQFCEEVVGEMQKFIILFIKHMLNRKSEWRSPYTSSLSKRGSGLR